jgi:hypothetical protein
MAGPTLLGRLERRGSLQGDESAVAATEHHPRPSGSLDREEVFAPLSRENAPTVSVISGSPMTGDEFDRASSGAPGAELLPYTGTDS